MNKQATIFVMAFFCFSIFHAQNPDEVDSGIVHFTIEDLKELGPLEFDNFETLENEVYDEICNCVNAIQIHNKDKTYVHGELAKCIDQNVIYYQVIKETISLMSDKKKEGVVYENKNSQEYKDIYYQLEAKSKENCPNFEKALNVNNKTSEYSYSDNEKANQLYYEGINYYEKGDFKKAAKLYKEAVKLDPEFVFAWDNLGLTYRKMNQLDKAIDAYEHSLKVYPEGSMPLQNLAIAYEYKSQYGKAIETYEKLPDDNPEKYYGIGRIYTIQGQKEKALDSFCIAYNIYEETKSPYRVDAQNLISVIYEDMKSQGKEKEFHAITKKHNITFLTE